jgi:peptidoglycan/xylan/chitin deacetylase (PgdA/CDA1 family)
MMPCVILLLAALLASSALAAPPAPRKVAVTYDDLPGVGHPATLAGLREMNAKVLAALGKARVPAIGFVNEDKLQVDGERDARTALLAAWLDAGLALGNHTFSHKGLSGTPLPEYEDDVVRGDSVTRRLVAARGGARGGTAPFFRHPYTQTGPTKEIKDAFGRFLAARGYRVAPFTIEDADYLFAALYDDARAKGDETLAARLRDADLAHQDVMTSYLEELSKEAFGREISQVLLVHVNALNGDAAEEMLGRLTARGYAFVALEDALADPAYATPDLWVGRNGPSWLHRWRVALKLPDRMRDEPDPPRWVMDAYAALRR